MGAADLNPIEELKSLDARILEAMECEALRPIFHRVEEIARQRPNDFQVQLLAGDIKQRLVSRGTAIKERLQAAPDSWVSPVFPSMQPAPPSSTGFELEGTVVFPIHSAKVAPRPTRTNRLWFGVGALAIFGIAGVLLRNTDIRHFASWFTLAAAESIVEIGSVPPGASFQVGGRVNCGPGCRLSLPPGTYQIAALLDGYEPAVSSVTLTAGKQASIVLPLNPQPQTVRVLTDLAEGKVVFDGQVPASLRNGSFVLERVQPGHHSVKVMASNYEASFSFELAHARQPSVTGTVKAQNVLVLLVASLSNQSRFISSSGPWGLTVNGNAEIDAGPSGVDVKNFVTGENEFIVTQSNERHRVKENFSSPPTLTAFIRTDLNEGTLIVSTVESGVRIFVNNKEHLSRDGLLRVRTIGPVVVRVSKEGFEEPPPQIGEVRKGMQTRLDFTLKPIG